MAIRQDNTHTVQRDRGRGRGGGGGERERVGGRERGGGERESSMSRTIHAQQSLKMDAEHKYCHMPDRTNFHTKFHLF